MNPTRIALISSTTALVAWAAKAVSIAVAGGPGRSPFESPLFFVGLLALVTAAVSLGIAWAAGRPMWVRCLAGGLSLVGAIALTLLFNGLVGLVAQEGADRHWVWNEVNLWVAALVTLALAVMVGRREGRVPGQRGEDTGAAAGRAFSRRSTIS